MCVCIYIYIQCPLPLHSLSSDSLLRPISLLRLSLPSFVDSTLWDIPYGGLGIPPLKAKILLASNPLNSRILELRLAVFSHSPLSLSLFSQNHIQVVVAGVVVTKALFWTDLVSVFGLFVTDLAQSDYDHFSYDHLYAAKTREERDTCICIYIYIYTHYVYV